MPSIKLKLKLISKGYTLCPGKLIFSFLNSRVYRLGYKRMLGALIALAKLQAVTSPYLGKKTPEFSPRRGDDQPVKMALNSINEGCTLFLTGKGVNREARFTV